MAIELTGGCRVSGLREGAPREHGTVRVWQHAGRDSGAAAIGFMVLTLRSLRAEPARILTAAAFAGFSPLLLGSVVLTEFEMFEPAHRSRLELRDLEAEWTYLETDQPGTEGNRKSTRKLRRPRAWTRVKSAVRRAWPNKGRIVRSDP